MSCLIGCALALGACSSSHAPLLSDPPTSDAGTRAEPDAGAQPPPLADAGRRMRPVSGDGPLCDYSISDYTELAIVASACLEGDSLSQWIRVQSLLAVTGMRETANSFYGAEAADTCSLLSCIDQARGCDEIRACLPNPGTEPCDNGPIRHVGRCVSGVVERCAWHSELARYTWQQTHDCEAIDATCEVETYRDGRDFSYCRAKTGDPCERHQDGFCDGDELVVCLGGRERRVRCNDVLPGTTCGTSYLDGEFPTVVCTAPEPECSSIVSGGVDCEGSVVELCVAGRTEYYDCRDYGFSGCDGSGCVE